MADNRGVSKPNAEFLKHHFLREGRLTESQALYILEQATGLLASQPNLVDVESPVTSESYVPVTRESCLLTVFVLGAVCGDIHGQYVSANTWHPIARDLIVFERPV